MKSFHQHISDRERIDTERTAEWEKIWHEKLWSTRPNWFMKPLACIRSPYEKTVWIDIDCQVRRSIAPLFPYCETPHQVTMGTEPEGVQQRHLETKEIELGETEYNSGVIAFRHGAPLMKDWLNMCLQSNHLVRGDQEAFSKMLFMRGEKIESFPDHFNRSGFLAKAQQNWDSSVVVWHWSGGEKRAILEQIKIFEEKALMSLALESD